jgi:4-hydroxy-tetrahydrodipicolinate synthase
MGMIEGVFTALATPFTIQGALNEEVLRSLIRFQLAAGVQGIVVLGSTGETPTLTSSEKERIIAIAREEIPNTVQLMVGTGTYSTASTIDNTRIAHSLGADSVLIVTPYYNKPTQEGLFLHYKAIAESVKIPIMVYNNQSRTAVNIQTETLVRIAKLPNIIGVKEASGNILQISEVIEKIGRTSPEFSILCGDDALTFPSIALGANGILSVLSNLIPIQICALTQAALTGEYAKARELHYSLMPLFRMAFVETNPIALKAAMRLCGIDIGPCRLPLCSIAAENENKLKNLLKEFPLSQYIFQHQELFSSVSKIKQWI